MADTADEKLLDDFEAALELGQKVMEMAERLEPVDRVTPGAQAAWRFMIDGVHYKLVMAVDEREQPQEKNHG